MSDLIHLALYCAAHAPAEVEYVCNSFAWSGVWFFIGWIICAIGSIIFGGHK